MSARSFTAAVSAGGRAAQYKDESSEQDVDEKTSLTFQPRSHDGRQQDDSAATRDYLASAHNHVLYDIDDEGPRSSPTSTCFSNSSSSSFAHPSKLSFADSPGSPSKGGRRHLDLPYSRDGSHRRDAAGKGRGRRLAVRISVIFIAASCVLMLFNGLASTTPWRRVVQNSSLDTPSPSTTSSSDSPKHAQKQTSAPVAQLPSSAARLEPEWEWAREVSIVYTWVNGSDPEYRRARQKYGGKVGGNRDRDNDDLRFSLRTLERYMPWHTGKVYVVSPSRPTWASSRLHWIDQNRILPESVRPTFSSNVVEQYLHLVPGLTEHFIHMNDDYMLVSPIHPRDLFTISSTSSTNTSSVDDDSRAPPRRGVKQFVESNAIRPLPLSADPHPENHIWIQSVYGTYRAIERAYPALAEEGYAPHYVKHAPFVYTRTAFEGMHRRFRAELARTARHKFRHWQDVVTPLLVHAYVAVEGALCCGLEYERVVGSSNPGATLIGEGNGGARKAPPTKAPPSSNNGTDSTAKAAAYFLQVDEEERMREQAVLIKWKASERNNNETMDEVRKRIAYGKLKFLTFNDEMGIGRAAEAASLRLEQFYEELFGIDKSRFEQ